jgi:hypothetical protein
MVRTARRTLDDAAAAAGSQARPVLVASLAAILGDPSVAIVGARLAVGRYMAQPNYRNNLLRAGFAEADLDGPSDRLVNALVAMGDADTLRGAVAEMHGAGADHVTVIPFSVEGRHAAIATARAVAP